MMSDFRSSVITHLGLNRTYLPAIESIHALALMLSLKYFSQVTFRF